MSEHEEDGPPSHRLDLASLSTLPPPAEPGTEASAALDPFPKRPPGPVGLETILIAIREGLEGVHGRIDRQGEDVGRLIVEVRTLCSRVSGIENAVNRRRERDEANQEAMRQAIHGWGTALETFRGEIAERFEHLEKRVSKIEERLDAPGGS